MRKRNDIII